MLPLLLITLAAAPAITAFECGIANPDPTSTARVVGGQPHTYFKYPWFAAIHAYHKLEKKVTVRCGGALIAPQFVMTSAYCYELLLAYQSPRNWNVTLGAFSKCVDTPGAITYRTADVYIPLDYEGQKTFDDIAIVKLDGTSQLMPVCLPPQGAPIQHVNDAHVAGFGMLSRAVYPKQPCEIHEALVDILTNEECVKELSLSWSVLKDDEITGPMLERQVTFCTIKPDGKAGSCAYDEGNPVLVEKNNRYFAVGISSYSERCSVRGFPTLNTNVASFIDWINESIGGELEIYQPKMESKKITKLIRSG